MKAIEWLLLFVGIFGLNDIWAQETLDEALLLNQVHENIGHNDKSMQNFPNNLIAGSDVGISLRIYLLSSLCMDDLSKKHNADYSPDIVQNALNVLKQSAQSKDVNSSSNKIIQMIFQNSFENSDLHAFNNPKKPFLVNSSTEFVGILNQSLSPYENEDSSPNIFFLLRQSKKYFEAFGMTCATISKRHVLENLSKDDLDQLAIKDRSKKSKPVETKIHSYPILSDYMKAYWPNEPRKNKDEEILCKNIPVNLRELVYRDFSRSLALNLESKKTAEPLPENFNAEKKAHELMSPFIMKKKEDYADPIHQSTGDHLKLITQVDTIPDNEFNALLKYAKNTTDASRKKLLIQILFSSQIRSYSVTTNRLVSESSCNAACVTGHPPKGDGDGSGDYESKHGGKQSLQLFTQYYTSLNPDQGSYFDIKDRKMLHSDLFQKLIKKNPENVMDMQIKSSLNNLDVLLGDHSEVGAFTKQTNFGYGQISQDVPNSEDVIRSLVQTLKERVFNSNPPNKDVLDSIVDYCGTKLSYGNSNNEIYDHFREISNCNPKEPKCFGRAITTCPVLNIHFSNTASLTAYFGSKTAPRCSEAFTDLAIHAIENSLNI